MSFSKNLTITVRNTIAQLDEPLYVYEKDRNLIMYFKIMDYKYKFDKNPTNVLASVDDIMEAYATIVDPNGYELTRQYGEVIEDEIKFVITDDLIDELDEIGTYRIQFHIKCQHSEFTIPEISFEVLERLKGFRTVTDEGEVGDEILNNSESFIDEEGKLHLVWREGDTISSVRLNQMVEVVNNAVDEEHQRQINEVNRENRANAKLEELETRFSALTTSQQQSAEVIDARDGEASLKVRLDRDVEKAKQIYVNVEGSHISTDSSVGYLKDVEILGNTVQDPDNLADIRSVGDKVEGQELYEIPVLSCGKNIWNPSDYNDLSTWIDGTYMCKWIKLKPNTTYSITNICKKIPKVQCVFNIATGIWIFTNAQIIHTVFNYKNDSSALGCVNTGKFTTPSDGMICLQYYENSHRLATADLTEWINEICDIQLEEGTQATPYEPYQEDKLTILSPVQLEKVGDVRDRIIEKDGVWGVEKNVIASVDENNVLINTKNKSEFIPLPHDQQVKLRTFANKTNISFLTEIEGTIKAQVPKSLGATVNTHTEQISNLNKELDRVKKLEESTVSTVATESDFTTVEATNGGYFEDVKLEGKTLVNLPRRQVSYYPSGSNDAIIVSDSNVTCYEYEIKPNTTYTIKKDEVSDRGTVALFSSNSVGSVATKTVISMISDGKISTIRTGNEDKYMLLYVNSTLISSGVKTTVLEGDHTQNPPAYFEGLKSVGQDVDEIVVSSVGENIISNIRVETRPNGYGYHFDDIISNDVYYHNFSNRNMRIHMKRGDTYVGGILIKPKSTIQYKLDEGVSIYAVTLGVDHGWEAKEYDINQIFAITKCEQSDKKRLLYYNNETQTWEKPIPREWDSIEKHTDGKYYYHQRSGEVVLNGSEDWKYSNSQNGENTLFFHITINTAKKHSPIICDTMKVSSTDLWLPSVDFEGVFITDNYFLQVRVNKSRLSTQDVAGFKQWLQTNNVTVVYQLAQEKVYECTNIDLITYANETNYIVESGAIVPKTTLKVHNNIANVISALQKKVSVLESNYATLFNTITVAFNSLE